MVVPDLLEIRCEQKAMLLQVSRPGPVVTRILPIRLTLVLLAAPVENLRAPRVGSTN